jgi:acyl-coenzyme A synthetase/AMP-(fatty) acid ligase
MTFLSDRIEANLRRDEGVAIEFREQWVTREMLNRLVRRLAGMFDGCGLAEGAAIAVMIRNHPQSVAAIVSIWGSRRCVVILNALAPDERIAADLERLRPPLVLAERADWARPGCRAAAQAIGAAGIELPASFDDPPRFVDGLERVTGEGHMPADPEVAVYMLSSGTTGVPKRVPVGHDRLERIQFTFPPIAADGPPRPQVQFLFGSLAHMIGVATMFGFVAGENPLAVFEKFTVPEWRAALARHRPASISLPPAALRMVLDAGVTREELAGVRAIRTGTSPLAVDLADEVVRRYGVPLLATYGATEFAGAVASWTLEDFHRYWPTHRGAAGRLHPGVEARIVDAETDAVLSEGAEGIIELRGPALGLGDWLRTTDRATLDAEGFVWIRGRADNAIIRGGFKVHPDEVNAVLEQHPAVREAFVVGLADERLGQTPAAAVILHAGAQATEAEILSWSRERLLPYQTPARLKIVEDFPRTPSFKPSGPGVQALFG